MLLKNLAIIYKIIGHVPGRNKIPYVRYMPLIYNYAIYKILTLSYIAMRRFSLHLLNKKYFFLKSSSAFSF